MMLAVRGATVVSLGETHDLIGPADILVTNGVIAAVGTLTDEQRATCDEIIDATGKLVLPGLVNAHLHSPASLSAGTVDDVSHADLTLEDAMHDESRLIEWIRRGVQGDWHACGTCRMGAADDRGAVVDPQGRVYGVENLRIVDASVMPSVPCANTNISTIMIGEKMADAILRARRSATVPPG
jgi:5-(hydroxymethyl)furfural/furfural oxidase